VSLLADHYTQESIQFIRKHVGDDEAFVGFSGGKDSIVLLDLVKRSGIKYRAFYNFTTIDPPELTRFMRKHYPEVTWLMPEMNFWDLCRKKNMMPTRKARFCCDSLKHNAKATRALGYEKSLIGVRAEESPGRLKRGAINSLTKKRTNYMPIFEWSAEDIWEYIHDRGLPYPSLYDEGFHRLGCVVCPFVAGRVALARHKARWPSHYRILDRLLAEMWDKNKDRLIDLRFTEDTFKAWPAWGR
jgi:phosphoadenosine phosphosulfate reductase